MPDDNYNIVNDAFRYSTEQFDKNILYIASGALGISFAFIKDIIPNLSSAEGKESLTDSWYIFASVIFISLITHYISMLACRWALKHNNKEASVFNRKIEYWNWPIRILNGAMIIAILVGAIKLINFINCNINQP